MYAKVFRSLWSGSLGAHWEGWTVFVFLLAHADAEGFVEMTREAIARISGLPRDVVDRGIEILEAPDPLSRSTDHEGARLVRLDPSRPWGWLIVNYCHYRSLRDAEAVRAENRKRQRAARERVADGNAVSRGVTRCHAASRHAEEEGEVDGEASSPPPEKTTASPWIQGVIRGGSVVLLSPKAGDEYSAAGALLLPLVGDGRRAVAVSDEAIAAWSIDFPGVDVRVELGKMRAWLGANPTRRKTAKGMPRFVVNWLSREQDRSRGGPAAAPARAARGPRGRSDSGYAEANLKAGGGNG